MLSILHSCCLAYMEHCLHIHTNAAGVHSNCLVCQVVIGYTVGVAAMLLAFWSTPASLPWLQWATVFMIGFFLYGPQMLIGLCGAELVGPESVGASEGFLGWVAYLGKCFQIMLLSCACLCTLRCVPCLYGKHTSDHLMTMDSSVEPSCCKYCCHGTCQMVFHACA